MINLKDTDRALYHTMQLSNIELTIFTSGDIIGSLPATQLYIDTTKQYWVIDPTELSTGASEKLVNMPAAFVTDNGMIVVKGIGVGIPDNDYVKLATTVGRHYRTRFRFLMEIHQLEDFMDMDGPIDGTNVEIYDDIAGNVRVCFTRGDEHSKEIHCDRREATLLAKGPSDFCKGTLDAVFDLT